MKLIKSLFSSLAALFLGKSVGESPSSKKLRSQEREQTQELQKRLNLIMRPRDDITIRSLCRTINQRKRRNLMRWARANGSA